MNTAANTAATGAGDEPLKLFGRFDFTSEEDRKRYGAPVADIFFAREGHLRDHLLGKGPARNGLLYRLMSWNVRFSLIHGDLHTRNVLADRDNVWLLDHMTGSEAGLEPLRVGR